MNPYTQKISRFEFKKDPSNDMLVEPDDCHYDTEAEAMYFSLFAACGCGNPCGVHQFLIDSLRQFEGEEFPKPGVNAIKEIILKNPKVAAEFVAHYLTSEGFMEHGGSVYGSWLTERGKQFIEVGPMSDD